MLEDGWSSHLVVVGSSGGSLQALSAPISTLQKDLPVPAVIAQHLDPDRGSWSHWPVVSPDGVSGAVGDGGLGFGAGYGEVGGVDVRAMRESAALLGDALRASSRPDAGTKVEITVPLAQEDVR